MGYSGRLRYAPPYDEVYSSGIWVGLTQRSDAHPPAAQPEAVTRQPGEEDQDWRAELEAVGIKPAPPDHWAYRQGTVFVVPDPPEPEAHEDS
jgi:hypothetical protein